MVSPRTPQPRVLVLHVGYINCYLFVKTKYFNYPLAFSFMQILICVRGLDKKFELIGVVDLPKHKCAKSGSYLSFPPARVRQPRGFNKLTHSGQVTLGDGAPELNWPNVPQAGPCLTTKLSIPQAEPCLITKTSHTLS